MAGVEHSLGEPYVGNSGWAPIAREPVPTLGTVQILLRMEGATEGF